MILRDTQHWFARAITTPESEPSAVSAEGAARELTAGPRLSPLERAAFLLHDVFGAPFEEVAETIGRDAAACRQLASRARAHVRAERPRYEVSPERGLAMAEAFFAASRGGDMAALRSMLAAAVTIHSDGGGKRPAALAPIVGIEEVMRVQAQLVSLVFERLPSRLVRYGLINGLPGFVTLEGDGVLQTTALEIVGGKIAALYVMRNPDKLRHLEAGRLH